uniref:Uncharacterized protein n=1 Tax=Amphimedon queenslandica TaxID=400682 RepID=A0A1X7UY98_AMPQE
MFTDSLNILQDYFKFIGRVCGMAIYHKNIIDGAPGVTVRGESVDSKVVPQAPNAKQPAAPPTSINSEIKLPDTKRKKLN